MTDQELKEIYKLKNIIRYNNRLRLKYESVAEHSFYVALISLMLCEKHNLDISTTIEAVVKSLLHDMPEIEINDITHDAKEKLNIRPILEKYEKEYYQKHFPTFVTLMYNSDELTSTIVDLADALSVKQYVLTELDLGNKSDDIKTVYDEINVRIDKLYSQLKELL